MREALLALIIATMPAQQVEFDVVSLKPAASVPGLPFGCHGREGVVPSMRVNVPTAMCVGNNVTAEQLTAYAYDVGHGISMPVRGAISGEPDWFINDRYSIQAKADNPPAIADMRRMLQTMLADRFKLRVHLETREVDGFVLSVAAGGLKLDMPKPEDVPQATAGFRSRKNGTGAPSTLIAKSLNARNIPMDDFAKLLSNTVMRPVLNQTAAEGKFTFIVPMFSDEETSDVSDLSFPPLTVVLQKLGLRLEKQKVPMTVVVIEHVEKPALN